MITPYRRKAFCPEAQADLDAWADKHEITEELVLEPKGFRNHISVKGKSIGGEQQIPDAVYPPA